MLLLQLFWIFFQIGLFSIGGGYAILPMIQHQIVNVHHWLSLSEMADIVAISQMTPGPIALNAATFVGVRLYGLVGGAVATLGCIAPSCIIVIILARYFFKNREISAVQGILKGIRPAVVALIAVAGLSVFTTAIFNLAAEEWLKIRFSDLDFVALALFLLSFFALRKFKASILTVMGGAAVLGIALYSLVG